MSAAVYPWERPNDSFLHLQEDASGQLQDEYAQAEPDARDGVQRKTRHLALGRCRYNNSVDNKAD